MMLIPLTQFFNSLEERRCDKCGEVLEEQADCYNCTCSKCDTFQAHPSFTVQNQQ